MSEKPYDQYEYYDCQSTFETNSPSNTVTGYENGFAGDFYLPVDTLYFPARGGNPYVLKGPVLKQIQEKPRYGRVQSGYRRGFNIDGYRINDSKYSRC